MDCKIDYEKINKLKMKHPHDITEVEVGDVFIFHTLYLCVSKANGIMNCYSFEANRSIFFFGRNVKNIYEFKTNTT